MHHGYDYPLKLNRCNAEMREVQLHYLCWKWHILCWFCNNYFAILR